VKDFNSFFKILPKSIDNPPGIWYNLLIQFQNPYQTAERNAIMKQTKQLFILILASLLLLSGCGAQEAETTAAPTQAAQTETEETEIHL
jgi:hypothetical protein